MYSPGEKTAWSLLKGFHGHPEEVAKRAGVSFKGGAYVLQSFGSDVFVNPEKETITSRNEEISALIKRTGYFYNHLALWWLVNARGIPATGRLIKPTDLKGGEMFFRGTHALPLDRLASIFGGNKEGFLKRARSLGAKPKEFGDVSAEFFPVNGLSMLLLIWLADEEFPARADLLLDSSWEIVVPLDIIWCASMLTVLAMF